jgi:hypothetical protein
MSLLCPRVTAPSSRIQPKVGVSTMVSDAIVAIVPDDVMPAILTLVHRAGLGHNARVIRPKRAPIREQLRRAGVPTASIPARIDDASAVLMIMAAARSPVAAELAHQNGASATWVVTAAGSWNLVDDHVVKEPVPTLAVPDVAKAPISVPATMQEGPTASLD